MLILLMTIVMLAAPDLHSRSACDFESPRSSPPTSIRSTSSLPSSATSARHLSPRMTRPFLLSPSIEISIRESDSRSKPGSQAEFTSGGCSDFLPIATADLASSKSISSPRIDSMFARSFSRRRKYQLFESNSLLSRATIDSSKDCGSGRHAPRNFLFSKDLDCLLKP